MITYHDLEVALKRVPLEQLPEIYDFILARALWPFDATPAEMETDDLEWDRQFASEASQEFFSQVGASIRAEIADGKTEPLDALLTEDEANDDIENHEGVQTTVPATSS